MARAVQCAMLLAGFALAAMMPAVPHQGGGGCGACRPAPDPEAVRKGVVDPYVEVAGGLGTGSGTVVDAGGEALVLTAGHLVGEAKSLTIRREVRGGGEESQAAEVAKLSPVEEDGGIDLALLRPENPTALLRDLKPAVLGGDYRATPPAACPLHEGEDAWYCGSGGGVRANLNRTIINRGDFRFPGPEGPFTRFFVVNGNGYYGHSGSGVFVRRAGEFRLVGVVLRIRGDYPKSPVFCRRLPDILAFVKEYKGVKK